MRHHKQISRVRRREPGVLSPLSALLIPLLLSLFVSEALAQRAVVRPPPSADDSSSAGAETRDEPEAPPRPPELLQFVQADYPPEALEEGLEAEVLLRIVLDEVGDVVDVEVVEGAGRGFDEAAVAAVRQFRFQPASVGGQDVGARILYRYRFELTPEPEPEEASTATVTGVVTDLDGAPVLGAQVLMTPVDGEGTLGEPLIATTDGSGRFEVEVTPMLHETQVEASGFVTFRGAEPVVLDGSQELTFRLEREGATYETVIRARRPGEQLTTRTISRREVNRVPGASGDPIRVIQNMPGMNRTPVGLGLLLVRGSPPGDTNVMLESIDVPLLYHFGGLNSVINPRLIESIDFMPGNYPVRYGNAHGGIIEVRLRELQRGEYVGWHGEASIDIFDVQLQLEGPITDELAFAVAARRSYIDAIAGFLSDQFEAFELTTSPVYWDWQAILQWTPSSRHFLRVIGYGSDDRLRLVTQRPPDQGQVVLGAISNRIGFNGAILEYRYRPEASWSFDLTAGAGQFVNRTRVADIAEAEIETIPVDVRPELTIRAGDWGRFLFGARLRLENQSARITIPDFTSGSSFPESQTRPFEQGTAFNPTFYAEAQLSPVEDLRITTGLHLDIDGPRRRAVLEPRFWLRYQLLEGTAIEGGVGMFHQEPGFFQSDPFFGNPNIGQERSVHYGIGIQQQIWGPLNLTINGFYKQLDRLGVQSDRVAEVDGELVPLRFEDTGEGRVYGMEALLRLEPTERFFGWVSYTLMRSERRDSPRDDWELFTFDQTHILTVVAGVSLPRGWEIGLRFQLSSGRPYTPFVGSVYQADIDDYVGISGESNSERAPLFHQLDLRVDKTWTIRNAVRIALYLDLQNVYFSRNVEAYFYSFDYSQRYAITGLPILPNIGINVEF